MKPADKPTYDLLQGEWYVSACDCGFTIGAEPCVRCHSKPHRLIAVRATEASVVALRLSEVLEIDVRLHKGVAPQNGPRNPQGAKA